MVVALILFGCNTPNTDNQASVNQIDEIVQSTDIQVYYFHNTKRCATCKAIEDETLMALQMFYPEQSEAGTIEFTSLNLEEEEGESLARALRYSCDDPTELLSSLHEIQSGIVKGLPFNYSFFDEEVDQLYSVEYRTGKIIKYFTIISIIISLLGLLGMALYDLELRKKEIAIRKVLASSVNQIIEMILKRYFIWIIIAFVIATPIAFYLTTMWLQGFAYGIRISPWTYLFSLLSVILIASLTLGFLSRRSARENPAQVLKYN